MSRASLTSRAVGLVIALTLGGCATTQKEIETPAASPTVSASALERLVAPHRERAMQLESQGDLRAALNEWRVALTIDPRDNASIQGKERVQERINTAITDAMNRGREAMKRGVQLEARRYFLRVLALDPGNKAAFDVLKNELKETRFLNHTVRRGETLASIAELYYHDRSRLEVIWETNQLPANPKLEPGTVLKIPEIPGVPFSSPSAPPPPRAAEPPAEKKPAPVVEEQEPEVNPMLAEAREAYERKEFSLALANLDRFLSQNPRNTEAADLKKNVLYQQGKIFLDQKKYAESYAALNQLAKLSPNYQDSSSLLGRARTVLSQQHYNEGIRLYREEKLEGAIAEWRAVLQYDPNHEGAKKNIEQAERLLKGLQQRQQKK